ncbi:hypothetical protein [Patiriisocius sp. Uisw_017]|uniref:hypothetical protein n=1 Tax=Patiriisocius sp. Uisw_017 TaxID=3230968 RepID=UPI0039E8C22F
MAITNRAVSAEFKALGLFAKSAKSFDLAFREIKIKQNAKAFAKGLIGKVCAYQQPYLP